MKKNHKIKLVASAIIIIGSITNLNVRSMNLPETNVISNISDGWEEIRNRDGIQVFVQRINENEKLYLKVKFVNLKNKNIEFNWALMNGKSKVLIKAETKMEESTSLTGDNFITKLFPIKAGDLSGYDCSISISIK